MGLGIGKYSKSHHLESDQAKRKLIRKSLAVEKKKRKGQKTALTKYDQQRETEEKGPVKK